MRGRRHCEVMTTTQPPEAVGVPPATDAPTREPDARAGVAVTARWRDVTVGAAFVAGETVGGLIGGLRRTVVHSRRLVAGLAERGAVERQCNQRRAVEAVRTGLFTVATSTLADRVVDAHLDRVLRPVVRTVLDDVLRLLEDQPDRIRPLVRGQRESMVDELVGRIRTGAATGDSVVDRLTIGMFRREPRTARVPPSPVDL
jgi:hypothetical protein